MAFFCSDNVVNVPGCGLNEKNTYGNTGGTGKYERCRC